MSRWEELKRDIRVHSRIGVLIIIFGTVTYLSLLALMGKNPIVPLAISLSALFLAIYYAFICIKIYKKGKRIGIDVIMDEQTVMGFSIILGTPMYLISMFALFFLIYLNAKPATIMSVIVPLGIGIPTFALILGIIKSKGKSKVKVGGFKKEGIPLAIVEGLIAAIIFLAFRNPVFEFVGCMFLLAAIVSLVRFERKIYF